MFCFKAAIRRFTPQERDCYVHDEVNLKSLPLKKGYRMSMKNCLYDKALQATKARTNQLEGCITYIMVKTSEASQGLVKSVSYSHTMRV